MWWKTSAGEREMYKIEEELGMAFEGFEIETLGILLNGDLGMRITH
jgi:hypothetical protein